MSTEARREAIAIVVDELERLRGPYKGREPDAGAIVDKLLETHAISRRSPRLNVRSQVGSLEHAERIR